MYWVSMVKIYFKNEQMELTDSLHAGTNSGKLKVDLMIFGLEWSRKSSGLLVHDTLKS